VLGQAHAPWRRLLGISVAASCALALPAIGGAGPPRSSASLKAENAALASHSRSAVLSLYALDTRLTTARAQLDALQRRAARLRRQRAALAHELEIARVGARVSRQRLASRVRLLFDHGDTSAIEVIFGARSLDEALVALDGLSRVTSINQEVLTQLRSAKTRIGRASRALAVRQAKLAAATRAQTATTRALEAARSERAAYISELRNRLEMNSLQIDRIEAQARAAGTRSQQLAPTPGGDAVVASPVAGATGRGRTLTVSAVAYSLPGRTASGLPVGWGVVAVDPSVIPLGTRMNVPGYGEAVAADTGTAIVGTTIDLWFPTLAQARAWGRRSVTITLD
jgi:3D (Asp-Asp-Asp) domain-containing protein/peptidoglycan hydrolase CwlO-like protein